MLEKEINKIIDSFDFSNGKYNVKDIFRDIIELETYFIYVTMLQQKDKLDSFNKIVSKYTEKEQIYMWQILYNLTNLYNKQHEPNDILGEIFNKLNIGNARTGQFFTPTHISKAIASIAEIDVNEIKENGYITISEPTCGAGGMILSVADRLKELGYDTYRNMFVQCWDIDRYCAMMTFIQLSMYDIPAQVIWGDTLVLKSNEYFYTPAYFKFIKLREENKLLIPFCNLCNKEIIGQVHKSQLISNVKLCEDCFAIEQRVLLMEKIMNPQKNYN